MRALTTVLAFAMFVPATALADGDDGVKTVIRDHVDTKPEVVATTPPPPVIVNAPPPPPPKLAGGYVEPSYVAYEGGKIPADAKLTSAPNMALVGAGLTVLGLSYVPSIIAAAATCPPQAKCDATPGTGWLYLPIAGPFVTAAMATSPGGAALAAFDGAVQLTGASLIVAGLVARKKLVMWQDKSASLTVTPGAGNAAGVSLTLTHL